MPPGACRLCGSEAELQDSHIIPAFIFRWVRETSGNGFLRYGVEPNKRVQDGIKIPLLCLTCEGRFSTWESAFAKHLFHPYVANGGLRLWYGPWLLKFGASLVWRVLTYYHEEHALAHYPAEDLPHLWAAEQKWREFLLGKHPHPGAFQIHLLPVDGVAQASDLHQLPPSINRYFLRTIDTDATHSKGTLFIYVKLPRFIFLGFARLDRPQQWKGTRLHATQGLIEPRKIVLPHAFGEYLNEKAERAHAVLDKMSPRQKERVEQSLIANAEKLRGSDLVRAMAMDVELFGDDAFSKT